MRPALAALLGLLLAGLVLVGGCASAPPLPVLHQVGPATLVDTEGQPFPLGSLRGQVWVAHFIFTRCQGPCPRMAAELRSLQAAIGPRDGLSWVSISADPAYDTPQVLKAYAGELGADPQRWRFLTGDAPTIADVAERGFLLPLMPDALDGGLVTHSLRFAVVDRHMQIRAYHDHFAKDNEPTLRAELDALLAEDP